MDILNRLDREITDLAGQRVPMYISEIGYSTKPGGEVTELQQAAAAEQLEQFMAERGLC